MTVRFNPRYRKSGELFERALRTIPMASQTFSKSHIAYPQGETPLFIERGKGSHVWDVDGNEYVDFINGLLPVSLGYDDPDVLAAVIEQARKGATFSLATELEIRVAEKLVELIPCAEMVRFGKNGSDATAGAIRIARAFTGRDRVAVCGYHGWQDWYIGSTARHKGVPAAIRDLTHSFPYNDLESLDNILRGHPGEFACVIMEAMNAVEPAPGYLHGVKDLCREHGALFVLDEIITGFRYALGGAQELFGVTPDLAAFGKSMGNGYPISAIVGRSDVMREMENIFFSFTAGGEAVSLAAACATIDKYEKADVIGHFRSQGAKIRSHVRRALSTHNLNGAMEICGQPSWLLLHFHDEGKATSWQIKTLFIQEMIARGILIQSGHNLSFAHRDAEIDTLLNAYDDVLPIIADAVHNDAMNQLLKSQPMQPIFQVR